MTITTRRSTEASTETSGPSASDKHRMDLKQHIRHVPDFPKAGILFYDITTLLRNPEGLDVTIDRLAEPYAGTPSISSSASRAAGSSWGAQSRSVFGPGSCQFVSRGSCLRNASRRPTSWSTARTRSRSTKMPLQGATRPDCRRCPGDRRHSGRGRTPGATPRWGAARAGVPDRAAVPERAGEAAGREGLFGPE